MYNKTFLERGHDEIEATILSMPESYTTEDFLNSFARSYPELWEGFIELYAARAESRAHAIQVVNSQLMHTVDDRFSHLTFKVRTIPNPKGGDMSEWRRT